MKWIVERTEGEDIVNYNIFKTKKEATKFFIHLYTNEKDKGRYNIELRRVNFRDFSKNKVILSSNNTILPNINVFVHSKKEITNDIKLTIVSKTPF